MSCVKSSSDSASSSWEHSDWFYSGDYAKNCHAFLKFLSVMVNYCQINQTRDCLASHGNSVSTSENE